MGSGEGGQERVFDAFRVGGFVELLGAGDFGGVGELLGMEGKVPAVEMEGAEAGGFLLRYDSAAYAPPLSSSYRLPCFAGDEQGFHNNGGNNNNNNGFSHKSGESCSTTTSSSSSNSGGRPSKPKKKAEQRREDPSAAAERGWTAAAEATTTKAETARAAAAATKKPRKEQPQGQQRPPPSSQRRTSKVRKEKLGERINALQQLVSPFGKTDTASVLHEALGYIRFLHDQVQVLSSPYLQRLPCSAPLSHGVAEARPDLRSRGLCLVPVACTAQVAASNGADLWSPAAMGSCGDDEHRQPAGLSKH